MKTAPFDLKKALAGHPLVTRDGRKATIKLNSRYTPDLPWPYNLYIKGVYVCLVNKNGEADFNHNNDQRDLFLLLPDEAQFPEPPKGQKYHNPANLTPEQVGVSDGWRLLLESEIGSKHIQSKCQCWLSVCDRWGVGTYYGDKDYFTYRTREPLPQPKQPRDSHGRFASHPRDIKDVASQKPAEVRQNLAETDPVNHPAHYTSGGIECIDAIRAALGKDGFIAFCRGNVIKYTWRSDKKGNPSQDSAKAEWYAKRAAEELKGN